MVYYKTGEYSTVRYGTLPRFLPTVRYDAMRGNNNGNNKKTIYVAWWIPCGTNVIAKESTRVPVLYQYHEQEISVLITSRYQRSRLLLEPWILHAMPYPIALFMQPWSRRPLPLLWHFVGCLYRLYHSSHSIYKPGWAPSHASHLLRPSDSQINPVLEPGGSETGVYYKVLRIFVFLFIIITLLYWTTGAGAAELRFSHFLL